MLLKLLLTKVLVLMTDLLIKLDVRMIGYVISDLDASFLASERHGGCNIIYNALIKVALVHEDQGL